MAQQRRSRNRLLQFQQTKMNERMAEPMKWPHPVHTHSTFSLQIPENYKQRQCLFQWISQNPNSDQNRFSDNYVLTRFDMAKVAKNNEYICTPLDYGCNVLGRVLASNNGEYEIVQEMLFGPVRAEAEVFHCLHDQKRAQCRLVVNKNSFMETKLRVGSSFPPNSQASKVNITIQNQDFRFDLHLDRSIRLPSNNSFFKFYDREQQCVGVSMYHQHSEFMQKLKAIKITSHFGFYLKLYFQSRAFRDAFLFQILENFGVNITQRVPDGENCTPDIEASPISDRNEIRDQINHELEKKGRQIDEEIYKLLYDQSEQQPEQQSLDMADAEFLLASTNKIDLKNSNLLKGLKESDSCSMEKKSLFLTEKKINQPVLQHSGKEVGGNTVSSEPKIYAKQIQSSDKSVYHYLHRQEYEKEGNENILRSTVSRLSDQVQALLKQNKKLSQQNKRLRDENMRLRFREIKKNTNKFALEKANRNTSKDNLLQSRYEKPASPKKSPTLNSTSPYMFRSPAIKNRSAMQATKKPGSQARNFTTYIKDIAPENTTSFIIANQNGRGSPRFEHSNKCSFNMISSASYLDYIKEAPEQKPAAVSPVSKLRRTKTREYQRPHDKTRSPSHINNTDNTVSKIIPQPMPAPTLSQLLQPPLVRMRNFGAVSSHYFNGFNLQR